MNTSLVDPLTRLNILKIYMAFWIDRYPRCVWSFETFMERRYRHVIPGTIQHARSVATHCFYCNRKFTNEKNFKASIDHYLPQSIGNTERYVICCVDCNSRKSDTSPEALISMFTNAYLRNKIMWGYHGKKLRYITQQIQKITHEMLYNIGPSIYYVKR